ncbi:MAG TPA: polysaccharide pyruvyl transferase family protein [Phycicoccus sp.]|nr:polysaccharide pyruvyl transferase family protein [Phycicoccus sp.]
MRVGLYGFFGMGNLGNEGSLAAVLAHLRAHHPDVEVVCFGADPVQVEREHGIPGRRLMAYRAAPGDRRPVTQLRKVLGRVWDLPRTAGLVGSVDVLAVPGTGVLESRLMSTPWGLPYWMAVAFTVSRVRRRPAALVSVGAEPATRRSTRLLMARTIRAARHVSYRDESSRAAAASMGTTGRPGTVAPDVAFLLPDPVGVPVRPGHVAVGVMTFLGGADDPGRGEEVLDRYVERMTEALTRLVGRGRTVTLLVGDRADVVLAERLEAAVRRRCPDAGPAAVTTSRADDLAGLMAEMAAAEVVVASRFHNVICALKAARPVVSLGYAGKNRVLLEQFGLVGFDQPIDDVDVDRLVADVEDLASRSAELGAAVAAARDAVEARAAEHVEAVCEALLSAAPRQGRRRRSG